MVDLADGQQVTLSKLLGKGFTHNGKPLEFKQVDKDNPYVYEASTNLSDEELAAGNNNVKYTFSFSEAVGNVVRSVDVLSEDKRQELLKKVLAERQQINQDQGTPTPQGARSIPENLKDLEVDHSGKSKSKQ